MNKKIIIKKAKLEDLKEIQKMSKALFEYEAKWHKTLDMSWSEGKWGERCFRWVLSGKGGIAYVAELENKIIGYLTGSKPFILRFRTERKFAELENIFVYQEYRHCGIGKLLTDEYLKWCREKGVKIVKVSMVFENINAENFYKKNGFIEHNLRLEKQIF